MIDHHPLGGKVETQLVFLRRQIQWMLLSRVVLLSLLLALITIVQPEQEKIPLPPTKIIFAFIVSVYFFTIASAVILKFFERLPWFAFLQISLDVFLTTTLVLFTGGSHSLFPIVYFFPIISSGLILYRVWTFIVAAMSSLCFGGLLFFEYLGYSPRIFSLWQAPLLDLPTAAQQHGFYTLTFFLVAFLSSMLSERLRKTEAALSRASLHLDRLSILYKQIFDDIATGIITMDGRGTITSFNRAAGEITRYGEADVVGEKLSRYFPGLERPTEDMPRPVTDLTRRDGSVIPVGFSWSILNMPGEAGEEKGRVFTFQDLSVIKKMENQVRQAEKMAGIGEMAAGIAHEFRNPLAAISGAAQVLREEAVDNPANQRLMDIIVRECDRLDVSIAEFLQFSKPASPEKKWFSLSGLISDLLVLLRRTPSWDVFDLRVEIPDTLDCWGDQNQIKQVFLNLLANSRQAIGKKGGTIAMRAWEEQCGKNSACVVIEIKDSGPGVKPEIMNRIFEPFFTTREQGTGLGLAIVWQIVESHDGSIQLANAEGRGALFTIKMPVP